MTVISAELGINHGGSLKTALRMVDAAAECGADAVKVQAYRVGDFLPSDHPDWPMFDACELSWYEIKQLRDKAADCGLKFGATPTSLQGVTELAAMGVDFLKNGSDFLLRTDMIEAMTTTGIPTWVAIGMADSEDWIRLPERCNLMLCTSVYPCPDEEANLARLEDGWFEGLSDHTRGITAATIAAALGLEMVEKHFTLNRNFVGPDHHFSSDPDELKALCETVRRVETLLGSPEHGPTPSELPNRDRWRVSLDKPLRS